MAVNRERHHLLVLPEDDATRSLAAGFIDQTRGQMQVLNPAGGWPDVLRAFQKRYIQHLNTYGLGHIVLLIDFDDDFVNRLAAFQAVIPAAVAGRVGSRSTAQGNRNEVRCAGSGSGGGVPRQHFSAVDLPTAAMQRPRGCSAGRQREAVPVLASALERQQGCRPRC
jgi:hypothetical protein